MKERRKLERKYLAVYSRVFDRATGKVLGYLSDMSRLGAMIISDDPMPDNTSVELRFDLPDPLLFSTDHLNVSARVAWCQPDINPAFYNVGFEFKSVPDAQLKIIDQMVELYEFRREYPNYPTPPSTLPNDS